MSDPQSPFGAGNVLDALERLKQAAIETAKSETELRKARALKTSETKRSYEESLAKHQSKTSGALASASDAADQRKAQVEYHFDSREQRINRAADDAAGIDRDQDLSV